MRTHLFLWIVFFSLMVSGFSLALFESDIGTKKKDDLIIPWHDAPLNYSGLPSESKRMGATGTLKILTILVEFSDVKHQSSHTTNHYKGMIDGDVNSMKTYYENVSYNAVTITGEVFGWYQSSHTMSYYGAPSGDGHDSPYLYKLVTEAVEAADPYVNFSEYDLNKDGWVDYLQIVHAGQDEAVSGNPNDIWSHKYYNLDEPRVDGVRINWYTMVSEFSPVGVMCHEFGHQLGLPDLYDTDGMGSGGYCDGAGVWDIMAAGAFLNGGQTPCFFSAWSRMKLGWAEVIEITQNTYNIKLGAAVDSSKIIKVPIQGNSNEYFLIENRQRKGYDKYLPGSGLLIWHIDESVGSILYNNVENTPKHKRVNLEEAHGGTMDLDYAGDNNMGDYRDPWSNSKEGFGPFTDPNSTQYKENFLHTFIHIKNIGHSSDVMTFDVIIDEVVYDIDVSSEVHKLSLKPDEKVKINITVRNKGTEDTYNFFFEKDSAEWGTVDKDSHTLSTGDDVKIFATISPPPGTPPWTVKDVTFVASPSGDETKKFKKSIEVEVLPARRAKFYIESDIDVMPYQSTEVNVTVENRGNLDDKVAMTLSGDAASWVKYLSDRISLDVGEKKTIILNITPPWGTLPKKYKLTIEGKSMDGTTAESATTNITLVKYSNAFIETVERIKVKGGDEKSFDVRVINGGSVGTMFSLTVNSTEAWNIRISESSFFLEPYQEMNLKCTVSPPKNEPAGKVVDIRIEAEASGYGKNYTLVKAEVLQIYNFSLNTSDEINITPGKTNSFTALLINDGNGEDTVRLSAIVLDVEGWYVEVSPEKTTLASGDDEVITIDVIPPQNELGNTVRTLSLLVESSEGFFTFNISLRILPVINIDIKWEKKKVEVKPGDEIKVKISITNLGNVNENLNIKCTSPEGIKSRLGTKTVQIVVGSDVSITCKITVSEEMLAGKYYINISAQSNTNKDMVFNASIRVIVLEIYTVEVNVLKNNIESKKGKAIFQVEIVNTGNSKETIMLKKKSGKFTVSFDNTSISLLPYEKKIINVTVKIPSSFSGSGEVVISAYPLNDSSKEVTASLKFEAKGSDEKTAGFGFLLMMMAMITATFLYKRMEIKLKR